MKIGYLSGPVDAVEVVTRFREGGPLNYLGTSYLSELLSVVSSPVVVTYQADRPNSVTDIEDVRVYNVQPGQASGIRYHVTSAWRMLRSVTILVRERVDVAVITEGINYWFITSLLRLFGIRIIPAAHGQLWSPFQPLKVSHRLLIWLNSNLFWRFQHDPILVASRAIANQIQATGPIFIFMPTYGGAKSVEASRPNLAPFRILCAGRIEEDKGVFDMVEVARILMGGGYEFELHFCGDGTQLAQLHEVAKGLPIHVHGHQGVAGMKKALRDCSVVVVPTRAELEEGFAMICAEGVLAGRPVVTSRAVPALEYIRPAAVEVEPNNVQAYANAFIRLMEDPDFYRQKQEATSDLAEQFFDPENGYAAKLATALSILERDTQPTHLQ